MWINIFKGFDFIHFYNKYIDILVHQTNITKKKLNKLSRSSAQGEVVQFYVVMIKENMLKDVNVTDLNSKTVHGRKIPRTGGQATICTSKDGKGLNKKVI